MSVMLISIMFVNMTSAAQIKDIKGTRVERQYSNHYSAQFNELWDSFGRSEISIYDINYNINDTYNPTTFNDTNGRDSAGYEILLKVDGKEVWLGNSHYKNNEKYDSIYYGYSGIELDNIWFNDNYEDAAGNKFTQVNIVLKNTNQISKVFSLATTSDIEVGHDDNAFCRFIGNGFTMSNMYADNSDAQGGNIPSVALNVYTNGIAGVTDADCVYIGEWKKRKQNLLQVKIISKCIFGYVILSLLLKTVFRSSVIITWAVNIISIPINIFTCYYDFVLAFSTHPIAYIVGFLLSLLLPFLMYYLIAKETKEFDSKP